MERTHILDLMGSLKLYGRKAWRGREVQGSLHGRLLACQKPGIRQSNT
jgi:hypothetical protein